MSSQKLVHKNTYSFFEPFYTRGISSFLEVKNNKKPQKLTLNISTQFI